MSMVYMMNNAPPRVESGQRKCGNFESMVEESESPQTRDEKGTAWP